MKKIMPFLLFSILCLGIFGCTRGFSQDSLQKTSSIISNNNRNMYTAEDNDSIYYVSYDTVKKVSQTDKTITSLYLLEDDFTPVVVLEYFKDRVYLITYSYELISMDTNGENVKTVQIPLDDLGEANYLFVPKVFDDNLYLIYSFNGITYKVDPDTLSLEAVSDDITSQYITTDGTLFTMEMDNDVSRVYITRKGQDKILFSGEDEHVIGNRMNFTNSYVYYAAYKNNDFDNIFLYRVDLDGKNKVLIKEFSFYDRYIDVVYDNRHIYIIVGEEELLKIDKETFKEVNIASKIDFKSLRYEILNGKFVYLINQFDKPYYIDSETGEKVEL